MTIGCQVSNHFCIGSQQPSSPKEILAHDRASQGPSIENEPICSGSFDPRGRSVTEYKPIAPRQLPKFAGIKTYMRLPHGRITKGIDLAVAGVPRDGATSYRTGQRMAPEAIREVSVTLRPYNLALDVDIFENCCGVDYGDVAVVPGYIGETCAKIEAELMPLAEAGVIPVVMGGDHSITLPELRAVARVHGPVDYRPAAT
jgi:agmatinase